MIYSEGNAEPTSRWRGAWGFLLGAGLKKRDTGEVVRGSGGRGGSSTGNRGCMKRASSIETAEFTKSGGEGNQERGPETEHKSEKEAKGCSGATEVIIGLGAMGSQN